jgi:integrase
MPKDLLEIPGEPNLLRHAKNKRFYTNYYDSATQKVLVKSTRETESIQRAKQIAQDLYKTWVVQPPKEVTSLLFDDVAVSIVSKYKNGRKKKTYLAARNQFRHLMKFFRGMRMCEINPTVWDEYVTFCRDPETSKNTERNLNDDHKYFIMSCLHAYHKGAMKMPLTSKVIPKPDIEEEVGRELKDWELTQLFSRCANPELSFQMELALKTGMRKREVLGLRYGYIDFDRGAIKLPPSVTKTKKGREFPFSQELVQKLKTRRLTGHRVFVFPAAYNDLNFQYENKTAWYNLLEIAQVDCRWHDLRHTCATKMVRAGYSETLISLYLGMSRKVLRRIYNHVNIDDLRPIAEAVQLPFVLKGAK